MRWNLRRRQFLCPAPPASANIAGANCSPAALAFWPARARAQPARLRPPPMPRASGSAHSCTTPTPPRQNHAANRPPLPSARHPLPTAAAAMPAAAPRHPQTGAPRCQKRRASRLSHPRPAAAALGPRQESKRPKGTRRTSRGACASTFIANIEQGCAKTAVLAPLFAPLRPLTKPRGQPCARLLLAVGRRHMVAAPLTLQARNGGRPRLAPHHASRAAPSTANAAFHGKPWAGMGEDGCFHTWPQACRRLGSAPLLGRTWGAGGALPRKGDADMPPFRSQPPPGLAAWRASLDGQAEVANAAPQA